MFLAGGEQQILQHLGLAEEAIPLLAELQDFDPVFLNPTGVRTPLESAMMNLISTGGAACLGKEPCAFCTAYFLGGREEIPLEVTKKRLDRLSELGIKIVETNDNFINLARKTEREKFHEIMAYANSKGIHIISFLTRPELLAKTPDDILKEFKGQLGHHIFMGVESGDPKTLEMMGRAAHPDDYLKLCREAAEKIGRHNLHSYFSFVFGFPDTRNPRWNGREADRRSLKLAAELIRLAGDTIMDDDGVWSGDRVNIQLNFYLPFPGSKTYQELIESGVSPESIDEYLIDTYETGEKFRLGLGGDDFDAETVILRGGREAKKIVDFSQGRRRKIADLIRRSNRQKDKRSPDVS